MYCLTDYAVAFYFEYEYYADVNTPVTGTGMTVPNIQPVQQSFMNPIKINIY